MSRPELNRRSFVNGAVAVAGTAALSPLLAACGGGGKSSKGGTSSKKGLKAAMPAYVPSKAVTPDIPSVNGAAGAFTPPGFLTYPDNPVASVAQEPGSGGKYSILVPLWGTVPPPGNAYYKAVNKALGATLDVKTANGLDMNTTLTTLTAAKKLPDWVQIPGWFNAQVNTGGLAGTQLADLTPYLAGDKIKQYPNLAAMPTGAWQCAAWEDRIYGIPFQSGGFNLGGQYFFRGDVFDDKGIKADEITSMDALFSLGKELTDAKGGVWAFDDLWGPVGPLAMYDIPSKFAVVDGKLKSVYELPQFAEALDWCHKAAKAGLIHPDALAGNSNDYKKRFYAGKALITADGSGSWNLADAQNGQAANPKFRRDSFKPFSADGTSAPKVYVQPTSRMFSYLNINLKPAQIEECLRIADFVAAPYGSREWLLINYGVEGVHWTKTAQGPTFTKTGIADVQPTTIPFLAAGPSVNANLGAPDITRAVCGWQAEAVKYAAKSPFWNMNITVPKRLATADAAQAVEDTIKDVVHGIKPVSSFQDALSTWKGSGGGDRLVAWYQTEVMDKLGTGL